jgi:DNA-binding transcriptional LysR family regulator
VARRLRGAGSSGNFSRAADERHMTQPAFSRRVRALEEWLGVDLEIRLYRDRAALGKAAEAFWLAPQEAATAAN